MVLTPEDIQEIVREITRVFRLFNRTDVMKLNYTRDEAAFALGVSVRIIDHLTKNGSLATRRIGSKSVIPREVLRKYAAADHPDPIKS